LKGITYGNGGSVRNTYDAFKRVTDNALSRSARSEYDTADRPMRATHTENGAHLYTGEAEYDAYNNLKTFKEKVGAARTAYQTGLT